MTALKQSSDMVSQPVKEVIEGLNEYMNEEWQHFESTLRQLYNHMKLEKCLQEKDLIAFIRKCKTKPLCNIFDFHKLPA